MMNETLIQLSQGTIHPKAAYKELYGVPKIPRLRKAHFIKLRIRIPDEKGVNGLLAFLLLFPIPLFVVRMILRRVNKGMEDVPISKDEIMNLISYKGILVEVTAHKGEKILIKTI